MGMMDPVVVEIPESHLEYAYAYFCGAALPEDLDPYVRGFAAAFLRRFPAADPAPAGVPDAHPWNIGDTGDRLELWEALVNDRFLDWYIAPEYEEGDPVMTYLVRPGFGEYAALYAIKVGCMAAVGGAATLTALAEDQRLHNAGNLWRLLDPECAGPEDREVARLFRKLMIDFRSPNEDFPSLLGEESVALLRSAEASRLRSGLPLLERFYEAIPPASEHDPRDLLRRGLQQVIGLVSSARGEDACLLCLSPES